MRRVDLAPLRASVIAGFAAPLMLACSDETPAQTATAAAPGTQGAACASLTPEQGAARNARFANSAGMNGVTFAREGGSASCKVDDGGDIACDMTAPGLVRVSGQTGYVAYFDIPAGRNARVSMSHDIARCVLN